MAAKKKSTSYSSRKIIGKPVQPKMAAALSKLGLSQKVVAGVLRSAPILFFGMSALILLSRYAF